MPFDQDFQHLHDEIVASGREAGVQITRADDIFQPGVVLDQILESIDQADIVIAVCTGQNANVFFELGYAWRLHNVVLVAENKSDLPFDVQHLRTVFHGRKKAGRYRKDLKRDLKKALGCSTRRPRPLGQPLWLDVELREWDVVHELIISNQGNAPVYDVVVTIPEPATNTWHFDRGPFDNDFGVIRPGNRVTGHITLLSGAVPTAEIILSFRIDNGERFTERHPVDWRNATPHNPPR